VLRLPSGATAHVVESGSEVCRLRGEDSGVILLGPRARGRVELHGVKLLFQLVPAGPPQPRPQLPPSLRAAWWQALDAFLAALIAAFLLAHVALVLYLRAVDWPVRAAWEELPACWIKGPLRVPTPPVVLAVVAKPDRPATTGRPSSARRSPRRTPAPSTRPLSPAQRAALEERARRVGINQVLGHLGESGALADLLRAGSPDRDQAAALAQLTGVSSATEEPGLRHLLRTPTVGRISGVEGLRGGGSIAEGSPVVGPVERAVQRIVRVQAPVSDGEADPALLARDVRSRLPAVRSCYECALKRDPRLAGKLLRFTVTGAGTVTGVEIDDDTVGDPELRACLIALVQRWRFPALPGPVEVSFPFVFQSGG
jgi:hypothetical protein